MKTKYTIDISTQVDQEEMEERFEKFYDQLKELRQRKTGGIVNAKAARKIFEEHLKHVASYYMVEYWDDMIDENIEYYLDNTDRLAQGLTTV
jgi:hypothetical protein